MSSCLLHPLEACLDQCFDGTMIIDASKIFKIVRLQTSGVRNGESISREVFMNYQEYKQLFDEVLEGENRIAPYTDDMYFSYTKLNRARIRRWDKQLILDANLVEKLKAIKSAQHWIIITEPWCGDAAHIIPFLMVMAQQNILISYDLCLRDTAPFLIDSYLTNGTKSIPKLVVRDENGNDLFDWGPRPKGAQDLVNQLKAANADFEDAKVALQHWYNEDRGQSLCKELAVLF